MSTPEIHAGKLQPAIQTGTFAIRRALPSGLGRSNEPASCNDALVTAIGDLLLTEWLTKNLPNLRPVALTAEVIPGITRTTVPKSDEEAA